MLNRANGAAQALSQSDGDPQSASAEHAEYAALETTLKGSELGRRFLADYARQHPTPEVKLLLDALVRLESASAAPERTRQSHGLVSELVAMSETISDLRREIGELQRADIPFSDPIAAPCAFEQIMEASARATSDVLEALEEIQSVATALRDQGVALDCCDRLDERAADIYTACARREIAGQQTADALNLLRDMERRIDALVEDWSDHEAQNLLDAAKALDVSEAFETAPLPSRPGVVTVDDNEPALDEQHQDEPEQVCDEPAPRRTNRLVPDEALSAPANDVAPAEDAAPARLPAPTRLPVPVEPPAPDLLSDGPRPFERPEPLTLEALVASQRAALFG
ncbi:hypothetical protein [Methyloceanibacter caenitepidi]|uniref:Chemotaxis protein n=1 Tax=Methyloceanibacter caenitepidi TaxID=1384459 RepID=A0A0A8K3J7_9HYPH|nr:hypothetical protein [Methyloceanibacter caenitepidi]BAQ17112.1 chemotaxis protein [Methyloceanibacter caenitepidi]